MRRIGNLQAPMLNTNAPQMQFGQFLMNNAQQSLELNQRKREQKALGEYRNNILEQRQNEADKKHGFEMFKYENMQKEKENKKLANTQTLKHLRPDVYSSIGQEFGQIPSKENAQKMNDVTGNMNLNLIKPNKPKYSLQKTDKGFVMFDTTNPKAEAIQVGGNYRPYEKPKSSSGGTERKTNEILNWMQVNKSLEAEGKPIIGFDKFYNSKQNNKKMGVGLRDADSVKKETARVSKVLNINPYQMSTYDFSTLKPQQKYEMDNLVAYREQGLKSKVPDWMKKDLDSLSAVVYSSGQVSKSLSSRDTGLIDASLNKVNQYLGLGDSNELAKRTLTQSNYQLYSNFMLKSLSGLAVTKPEEARFIKAFGSLFMNDNVAATKIKTNMENLSFRLENMKNSYDHIVFNYRYGNLQRGVDNAVKRMDNIIKAYNNNSPITNQNYVTSNGSKYQDETTESKMQSNNSQQRTIVRKGTYQGQRVIEYSDGSVEYE